MDLQAVERLAWRNRVEAVALHQPLCQRTDGGWGGRPDGTIARDEARGRCAWVGTLSTVVDPVARPAHGHARHEVGQPQEAGTGHGERAGGIETVEEDPRPGTGRASDVGPQVEFREG